MLKAAACSILIALIAPAAERHAFGAEDPFVFQGLGLHTTTADARRLYPHSSILDHHVYVSEPDVRNHIYAIDIPTPGSPTLRVFFERTVHGRAEYPRCDDVIATLSKEYGKPASVVEFDEERARNRRYTWTRPNATLAVRCFRIAERPLWASELSISTAQQ